MLALDNERWSLLHTAYGNGTAVAQWLARLSGELDQARKYWEEFDHYGYLCHQETVYTASYAAVPHLVELVRKLPPTERHHLGIGILYFVGDVAGCSSRDGVWLSGYTPQRFQAAPIPDDLLVDYRAALDQADELIAESIKQADQEELLAAMFAAKAAVRGYLWEYLSLINNERECPKCGAFVPPM
jgi:hypothetical protein